MKLDIALRLRLLRCKIFPIFSSKYRRMAKVILDPPFKPKDYELEPYKDLLAVKQEKSITETAESLPLCPVYSMSYFKEDAWPQHEYLLFRLQQPQGFAPYYWIKVDRGTTRSADSEQTSTRDTALSTPSYSEDAEPEFTGESQAEAITVEESSTTAEPAHPRSTATGLGGQLSVDPVADSKLKYHAPPDFLRPNRSPFRGKGTSTRSLTKSFKNLASTALGAAAFASNVSTEATDRIRFIEATGESSKKPSERLFTAYFEKEEGCRRPTVADILIAMTIVTEWEPEYSINAMCYVYATYIYEMMCRAKTFSVNRKKVDKGRSKKKRGRFYVFSTKASGIDIFAPDLSIIRERALIFGKEKRERIQEARAIEQQQTMAHEHTPANSLLKAVLKRMLNKDVESSAQEDESEPGDVNETLGKFIKDFDDRMESDRLKLDKIVTAKKAEVDKRKAELSQKAAAEASAAWEKKRADLSDAENAALRAEREADADEKAALRAKTEALEVKAKTDADEKAALKEQIAALEAREQARLAITTSQEPVVREVQEPEAGPSKLPLPHEKPNKDNE